MHLISSKIQLMPTPILTHSIQFNTGISLLGETLKYLRADKQGQESVLGHSQNWLQERFALGLVYTGRLRGKSLRAHTNIHKTSWSLLKQMLKTAKAVPSTVLVEMEADP